MGLSDYFQWCLLWEGADAWLVHIGVREGLSQGGPKHYYLLNFENYLLIFLEKSKFKHCHGPPPPREIRLCTYIIWSRHDDSLKFWLWYESGTESYFIRFKILTEIRKMQMYYLPFSDMLQNTLMIPNNRMILMIPVILIITGVNSC